MSIYLHKMCLDYQQIFFFNGMDMHDEVYIFLI